MNTQIVCRRVPGTVVRGPYRQGRCSWPGPPRLWPKSALAWRSTVTCPPSF